MNIKNHAKLMTCILAMMLLSPISHAMQKDDDFSSENIVKKLKSLHTELHHYSRNDVDWMEVFAPQIQNFEQKQRLLLEEKEPALYYQTVSDYKVSGGLEAWKKDHTPYTEQKFYEEKREKKEFSQHNYTEKTRFVVFEYFLEKKQKYLDLLHIEKKSLCAAITR